MYDKDIGHSRCPICSGQRLPEDASRAEKKGTIVLLQGRVYAAIRPEEANYSPFAHYCTVSLYPRRGAVKYLKFKSRQEMERWGLKRGDKVQAEGCLHCVDRKELVFDVRNIEVDPLN